MNNANGCLKCGNFTNGASLCRPCEKKAVSKESPKFVAGDQIEASLQDSLRFKKGRILAIHCDEYHIFWKGITEAESKMSAHPVNLIDFYYDKVSV